MARVAKSMSGSFGAQSQGGLSPGKKPDAVQTVSQSRHTWLPFTQMAQFDASQRTFVRGSGTMLTDSQGRRTFDVAEELAGRLAALTGLDRVFFSSDGASAIEVALKMALQYWQNSGQPQRTRFIRLVDAYHGDTAGAMSVSDIAPFKERFGPLTFTAVAYGGTLEELDAPDVAAIIVEPIVQAAAGMRIVPYAMYSALADRSTLLIVDEIATGFGRTGPMFAYERLALAPDLLCVGKGLTGGTLALSATLATDRIYAAFLGTHAELRHLFHGHSYAGNPIACAAALASLDLFETESTLERAVELARKLTPLLAKLSANGHVRAIRQAGLMCGIELEAWTIDGRGAISPAWRVANDLYDSGFFTRPIGDVVQLVPPLSSTYEELERFCTALTESLDA
jgi:adenosylmethionine-8-amino-7-oxononanoate aminotransferase